MFTDSNYSGVVRVKKIIVRGQFQAPSPALLALSNHLLLRPLKATFKKILNEAFRGLFKTLNCTKKATRDLNYILGRTLESETTQHVTPHAPYKLTHDALANNM